MTTSLINGEVFMDNYNRSADTFTKIVAWMALIIAVAALTLAWVAYDRTGVDLDQQIQDGANNVDSTLENTGDAIEDTTGDALRGIEDAAGDAANGIDSDDADSSQPQ